MKISDGKAGVKGEQKNTIYSAREWCSLSRGSTPETQTRQIQRTAGFESPPGVYFDNNSEKLVPIVESCTQSTILHKSLLVQTWRASNRVCSIATTILSIRFRPARPSCTITIRLYLDHILPTVTQKPNAFHVPRRYRVPVSGTRVQKPWRLKTWLENSKSCFVQRQVQEGSGEYSPVLPPASITVLSSPMSKYLINFSWPV